MKPNGWCARFLIIAVAMASFAASIQTAAADPETVLTVNDSESAFQTVDVTDDVVVNWSDSIERVYIYASDNCSGSPTRLYYIPPWVSSGEDIVSGYDSTVSFQGTDGGSTPLTSCRVVEIVDTAPTQTIAAGLDLTVTGPGVTRTSTGYAVDANTTYTISTSGAPSFTAFSSPDCSGPNLTHSSPYTEIAPSIAMTVGLQAFNGAAIGSCVTLEYLPIPPTQTETVPAPTATATATESAPTATATAPDATGATVQITLTTADGSDISAGTVVCLDDDCRDLDAIASTAAMVAAAPSGTTVTFTDVAAGDHQVRVLVNGHVVASAPITTTGDDLTTLTLTLPAADDGTPRVIVNPPGNGGGQPVDPDDDGGSEDGSSGGEHGGSGSGGSTSGGGSSVYSLPSTGAGDSTSSNALLVLLGGLLLIVVAGAMALQNRRRQG